MDNITYIVRPNGYQEKVKPALNPHAKKNGENITYGPGQVRSCEPVHISDLPSLEQCQEIINEIDCMIAEL